MQWGSTSEQHLCAHISSAYIRQRMNAYTSFHGTSSSNYMRALTTTTAIPSFRAAPSRQWCNHAMGHAWRGFQQYHTCHVEPTTTRVAVHRSIRAGSMPYCGDPLCDMLSLSACWSTRFPHWPPENSSQVLVHAWGRSRRGLAHLQSCATCITQRDCDHRGIGRVGRERQ